MYRGVNPRILNNQVKRNTGKDITSFNFALGGATSGECLYLLDKVLDEDIVGWEYLLFELNSVVNSTGPSVSIHNMHTSRNKYWLYPKNLWTASESLWGIDNQDHYSFKVKLDYLKNYAVHTFENIYNVSMYEEFAKHTFWDKTPIVDKNDTEYINGFRTCRGKRKKGGPKVLREYSSKMKPELMNRKNASIKYFADEYQSTEKTNSPYLEVLVELIDRCEKKGIQLIYVVPPLLRANVQRELAAIYQKLPKANRLECADASKYPDLYTINHIYDLAHLNFNGATFLSKITAGKFSELLDPTFNYEFKSAMEPATKQEHVITELDSLGIESK